MAVKAMKVNELRRMLWFLSGLVTLAIGWSVAIHYQARGMSRTPVLLRVEEIFRNRAAAESGLPPHPPLEEFAVASDLLMDGRIPERPAPPPAEGPPPPPPEEALRDLVQPVGIFRDYLTYKLKKRPRSDMEPDYEVIVGQPLEGVPDATLVRLALEPRPFRAVVLFRGKEEVLFVEEPEFGEGALTRPGAAGSGDMSGMSFKGPAGQIGAAGRLPDAVEEIRPGVYHVPRKAQDYILENQQDLLGQIETKGQVDSQGRPAGVQIQRIAEESMLRSFGFREKDVVLSVNGVAVKDQVQIINHFTQHPEQVGERLEIVFLRDGARQNRTLELPP